MIKKSVATVSCAPFSVSAYHLLPLSQESRWWFRLILLLLLDCFKQVSFAFVLISLFSLFLKKKKELFLVQRWMDRRSMLGTFSSSLPFFLSNSSLLLTRIRSKPTATGGDKTNASWRPATFFFILFQI